MALVPWPTELTRLMGSFDIGLRYPGQITHISTFTQQAQTLLRSPGIWAGMAQFAVATPRQVSRVERLEVFFSSMEGLLGTTEMPLLRTQATIPEVVPVVRNAVVEDGILYHLFDPFDAWSPGEYVRFGNRVYLVGRSFLRTPQGGQTSLAVQLSPQEPIVLTTAASRANTILVRRDGQAEWVTTGTPQQYGPWTFRWIEAV